MDGKASFEMVIHSKCQFKILDFFYLDLNGISSRNAYLI
mgnify:CR=1 FL=1